MIRIIALFLLTLNLQAEITQSIYISVNRLKSPESVKKINYANYENLYLSITDFFNANPGTFSLCRSILDGTADSCRAAMAQLMVAESSDGTADGCRAAMAQLMVA